MAKQMPKKSEESTGDWLNTYADMVTLLLTFFVLLFACSNMDENKFQYIVQAFQMRGKFINTVVTEQNPNPSQSPDGNSSIEPGNGGEGELPKSFDKLYQYLSEYIDENNLSESVSMESGPTHITIRFDDDVMFDGDSYVLKDEGRRLIAGFVPAIKAVDGSIQNLTVSGHTAKATYSTVNDYMLSAMRAVSVQNFLEFRGTVDSSKYIVTGYGPNKPRETDDTPEARAKNRRVEIMLTRAENEYDLNDTEIIKDILKSLGIDSSQYDPFGVNKDPNALPDGAADKVIAHIKDMYQGGSVMGGGFGPGSTDGSDFIGESETTSSE